jgi:3-deoxy-D-manno-octulosonate 8-phosphate phosphatase (KDO 8-P phosphatase)
MPEKDITALAAKVQMLLMDVDGVMTDGSLIHIPMADGSVVEAKSFNASDGAGIGFAHRAGIKTGIISGRGSADRRAEELKMDFVYQGLGRTKLPALGEILVRSKIPSERVCYIGDDLQDIPILSRVGFPVAVANAYPEVLLRVAYVTRASGGRGAIREVVELILKAQGKWEAAIAEFL